MAKNELNEVYVPPDYLDADGNINIYRDNEIVNFIQDNNKKSMAFLRSNRGFKDADKCMAVLYGDSLQKIPIGLSRVTVKKLRRQCREAIANATNIRPRWQNRSHKDLFIDEAKMYDNLRDNWWYSMFVDMQLKAALQYAGGGNTGYLFLWPEYDIATGELETTVTPLSWKQVLPYHAGVNATIDNVYGVTVYLEMALPEAHQKYPRHIDIIKADRSVPGFFQRGFKKAYRAYRGIYDWTVNKNKEENSSDPYPSTDIYISWIRDDSINESGRTVIMGQAGSHSSYKVPSLYAEDKKTLNQIDAYGKVATVGDANFEEVLDKNRIITHKECKLFPYQRYIITTNCGVIYDGPPLYLNRYRPIVPFKFEEVVGEFLGLNLIKDGIPLEMSNNRILQSIEDSIIGKLSPPIAISDKLPKSIINRLSRNVRRLIGMVFVYNPDIMAKSVVPLIDSKYYEIDRNAPEFLKYNSDAMDYQMGTNDSSILSKLNQMPGSDTIETWLKSLGTIATDQARGFERSMLQMAKIWLDFAPQVYTTERIITMFGAEDIMKALDFDPKSIIPKSELYPGCSYMERWQKHMRKFSVWASPLSIQENMSMTKKLTFAQMQKMGVPISNRRLYEAFIDDGQYDITKKEWGEEQVEKIMLSAMLQKMLQAANQEADPANQFASGIANMVNDHNQSQGRPSSFEKSPQLESKKDGDGLSRSTITTS